MPRLSGHLDPIVDVIRGGLRRVLSGLDSGFTPKAIVSISDHLPFSISLASLGT